MWTYPLSPRHRCHRKMLQVRIASRYLGHKLHELSRRKRTSWPVVQVPFEKERNGRRLHPNWYLSVELRWIEIKIDIWIDIWFRYRYLFGGLREISKYIDWGGGWDAFSRLFYQSRFPQRTAVPTGLCGNGSTHRIRTGRCMSCFLLTL